MIDHEAHVGECLDQRERSRQLAGAHEDVVRETGLADGGDAFADVLSPEPLGIGLVVHLVPDPDQFLAA